MSGGVPRAEDLLFGSLVVLPRESAAVSEILRRWHAVNEPLVTPDRVTDEMETLLYRTGSTLGSGGWVRSETARNWDAMLTSVDAEPRGTGGWSLGIEGPDDYLILTRVDVELEDIDTVHLSARYPKDTRPQDVARQVIDFCAENVPVYAEVTPYSEPLVNLGGSTPYEEDQEPANFGEWMGSGMRRLRGIGWLTYVNSTVAPAVEADVFVNTVVAGTGYWGYACERPEDFEQVRPRLHLAAAHVLRLDRSSTGPR